jgi:hypothetical protein
MVNGGGFVYRVIVMVRQQFTDEPRSHSASALQSRSVIMSVMDSANTWEVLDLGMPSAL